MSDVTHDSARVSWSPPDYTGEHPITSYGVNARWRNADDSGWVVEEDVTNPDPDGWRWVANAGAGATSAVVSGLPAQRRVELSVFARSGTQGQPTIHYGSHSSVVFTTLSAAPGPPEAVAVSDVTHDSARVSWSPPDYTGEHPITSYGIYARWRNADDSGWVVEEDVTNPDPDGWRWVANAGAGATSAVVSGLPAQRRVELSVFARSGTQGQPTVYWGARSAPVELTTARDYDVDDDGLVEVDSLASWMRCVGILMAMAPWTTRRMRMRSRRRSLPRRRVWLPGCRAVRALSLWRIWTSTRTVTVRWPLLTPPSGTAVRAGRLSAARAGSLLSLRATAAPSPTCSSTGATTPGWGCLAGSRPRLCAIWCWSVLRLRVTAAWACWPVRATARPASAACPSPAASPASTPQVCWSVWPETTPSSPQQLCRAPRPAARRLGDWWDSTGVL